MPDRPLVEALVAWYHAHARTLPWRSDPTPYKVLLSELMLQQTRVETVLPYFERFLRRWPRLQDLADATEEEVVEAWAGLGYYRRARHLHRCARQAVAGGGLPKTAAQLRALPGIGPYTAGAIASIAWGERVPLVDGNVERVLSRLDDTDADPRSPAGSRALWSRAEALHAACDAPPGDLNQALMELGATVCTPRSPSCDRCPIASWCGARASGRAEDLPRKAVKPPPRPIRGVAGLAEQADGHLLGRRRAGGLLGGLWEPLRAEAGDGDPRDALASVFELVGLRVAIGAPLGEVVHVFTHRRLTCVVHRVTVLGGAARPGGDYDEVRVVPPGRVGLSTLARKLLDLGRQPSLPLAAGLE